MFSQIGPHAAFTLLLTLGAIIAFSRDRIPFETSALAILVLLVATFHFFPFSSQSGAIRPASFFSGFGHEALVSISGLMILGRGLEKTGALRPIALGMSRLWPRFPALALLTTLVIGAVLSSFVNNTPIVVLLLPMLVAVCLRNDVSTSGVLLPMGLATSIGGMATTIGSSTNLLVVTLAADLGFREFGMFDFSVPVVLVGAFGIVFLWLVAPAITPSREPPLVDTSPRIFTGSFVVTEHGKLDGLTVSEVLKLAAGRMQIDSIRRGREGDVFVMKLPTVMLRAGDQLIVHDTAENLKSFEQELKAPLVQNADRPEGPAANSERLAEIAVTAGSMLDRRTLNEINFDERFELKPVAFHHSGVLTSVADIRNQQLNSGDILLVQGTEPSINALKASGEVLVLDGMIELPVHEKARTSLAIMAGVVAAAAFGLMPISVAAIAGVFAMLVTKCLRWTDVGGALSIPVILIIVASLALGSALIDTGGARFLAAAFLSAMSTSPPVLVLASVMICMAALTNIVSNNAAAIIGTPIAIDIATALGAPVEPFLLAVMFGANMSFATPIGYQTNLLVMSAGGYKFGDFLRVGIPLVLLMWIGFSIVLPILYGM